MDGSLPAQGANDASGNTSRFNWTRWSRPAQDDDAEKENSMSDEGSFKRPKKWAMGMLNDKETDEVPGM